MDGKNVITNYFLAYLKIFLLSHCYYSVYLAPLLCYILIVSHDS